MRIDISLLPALAATFMLVLATTLIVGNIIADLLLVALDPRIRVGGAKE